MKKTLSALIITLAAILLSAVVSLTAFAADSGSVSLDTVTAKAGETVEMTLTMDKNSGIIAAMISISYDDNVMSLVSVTDGGLFGKGNMTPGGNTAAVPYIIMWEAATSNKNITSTGTLAKITFKIKETAPLGESDINIKISQTFDTNLKDVGFNATDGKITVEKTECNHTGGTASFTEKAVCSKCGESYGELLALGKPESVTAIQNTSAIKLSWTKAENATGYRVYLHDGKVWKSLGHTTALSATLKNLKAGTKYNYAVRAYNITRDVVTWADSYTVIKTSTQAVKPEKIVSAQNASAIKLTWTKCDGADGYRIYYQSGGKWKIALSTTSLTSHTFKNLKSGTAFTFAVRPYIKTDSVIVWSDYNTHITSTAPAIPALKVTSPSAGKISLSWSAVNAAAAYELYYKTESSDYKLYKSYTLPVVLSFKLKSGSQYTFAVRACKIVDGKKIYSSYKPVSIIVK